jgi:hypothetical protein
MQWKNYTTLPSRGADEGHPAQLNLCPATTDPRHGPALDFWVWLEIWQTSGHLHERGRQKGQWQMCRLADIGPYASSNVRIDRMEANAAEAQITKRRLRLERQATICSS